MGDKLTSTKSDPSLFLGVTSIAELIRVIRSASLTRSPASFGITKSAGVSIERKRKQANAEAIALLDSLPPDFDGYTLTDEQRQILAGYTGLGGIGGSEYEYYTPQHVAAGMWEMMKAYGADTGNMLEPSAATGVFQETKPKGVICTSTEISEISGRINQLLHPEDQVSISPFEKLASNTPDDYFDSCLGNVPFGASRGGFAHLDPEYSDVKNVGVYFVLRILDKIKPNGLACIVVPYGMTSGKTYTKLREQVSRKAEFLGAHRLPSGTFEENGTATAVDIWVLRKHPVDLAEKILMADEPALKSANVLWETYLAGKWFEREGRKFQHGESSIEGAGKFKRLVVKNDQITAGEMKRNLAHKFESRIDWAALNLIEPDVAPMAEGEKRFINGRWYQMESGRLVYDAGAKATKLDPTRYGVTTYEELSERLSTSEGLLSLTFEQISAIASNYPETLPAEYRSIITFARMQPPSVREKAYRGSVIGKRIAGMQDLMASGAAGEQLETRRAEVEQLITQEVARGANPHHGRRVNVSGSGAADWLKFKASVTQDGQLSDLIQGTLDIGVQDAHDSTDPEAVIRHLFSQIDLDPVTLAAFRAHYTGELPADDEALLAWLADKEGVAISADGNVLPMDRATSGDIGLMNSQILAVLPYTREGAVKENYLRQLVEIKNKRKWTEVDNITFSLNSRWMDRRLMLEFLNEQGYDALKYIEKVEVEEGQLVSDLSYRGKHGIFVGYRHKTVMTKDKDTGQTIPQYKRVRGKDGFADQLENYLNGIKPRGQNEAVYLERIKRLEEDFNVWLRQHDEIDGLVQQYNDAFNAYIPYEHSAASLNLSGISGKRTPFGYQNTEVRRLSEDGRGILGFGTGLGKTTTGMALEAYNFENGRSKRTPIVVPKAVLENWYHEAQSFYSKEALKSFLFVGLDELFDDEGHHRQVPVLDENGQPKLDKNTGEPLYRNALKIASSATIKERMNLIPQSNYRAVVMTKEQYAAIPLREETITDNAYDLLFAQAEAGRVNLDGQKHKDAQKKNRILADGSNTGSQKQQDFPYFEDMGFDNAIIDEGHNYRNSYAAGREASMLAYLPTSAMAKSARDMAVKNAYLMKNNNGRGAVMLTATPLVNSPIDAFNMLSHVIPMAEWQRMGIYTPDDFVKVFGMTESVQVQKISGEIETKLGLVGFQNLDGLRGLFHRWATLKEAKDVANEVAIPDVVPQTESVPMTAYQQAVYEELRLRADALSKSKEEKERDARYDGYEEKPEDSIFAIIRDMDRVCTDPDLYNRTITFRFDKSHLNAVNALRDDLPLSVTDTDDDDDETVTASAEALVREEGKFVALVVSELYEKEVIQRLGMFGLSEDDITHPIPPKYSKLIANLKKSMVGGGKQIIFSDEKTQHEKLRRIIAQALGMKREDIGILNATTVAQAAKSNTKKLKKVKRPAEPKEDATPDQLNKYYEQKAAFDEYVAAQNDVSLGGLEKIAADYNEGRTPIIICNKKAEVGINLHIGTTAMHHLTLPWTPASLNQRNGRGARVGSSSASVKAYYYCGQGSFDEFRLDTLKRKANWIKNILTSDEAIMANADANNAEEMRLLLAADPEERERVRREQIEKAETLAKAKAKQRAEIDLTNYLKAKHASKGDSQSVEDTIKDYQAKIDDNKARLEDGHAKSPDAQKMLREQIAKYTDAITKQERLLVRMRQSENLIKRLRPEIKHAIDAGYLDVEPDILEHAAEYYVDKDKRLLRTGRVYYCRMPYREGSYYFDQFLVRVKAINIDTGIATVDQLWCDDKNGQLRNAAATLVTSLEAEADFSDSELVLKTWMFGGVSISDVASRLNRQQFYAYLKSGDLVLKDYDVFYRTEGSFDTHKLNGMLSNWLRENADNIVYPDANDEVLKSKVAEHYRGSSSRASSIGFLIALFGTDYRTAIDSYGETASPSLITELVAEYISDKLSNYGSESENMSGSGSAQLRHFLETGQYDASHFIKNAFGYRTFSVPSQYRNTVDFDREFAEQCQVIVARLNDAVAKQGKAAAHKEYRVFKSSLNSSLASVVERVQAFPTSNFRSFQDNYFENTAGYDNNFATLFADAVALGIIEEHDITESHFLNVQRHDGLFSEINQGYKKLRYGVGRWDEIKLKAGLISQEEVDKANAEKAQIEQETQKMRIAQLENNIIVKTNSTAIRGGKGANRYDYAPDGCYCFNDIRGKDGALFEAKDELKVDFSATYYNGRNPSDELAGSWWLISKEHPLDKILAVIQRHE
ncbi:SNF2-related protein [Xenorhabdus entomophaga]|uniref:SNF2-related protein n=1 Tax=Xenorhabdus entomophaga TaxID=3136257 RepID=UPI0030F41E1B